MRSQPESSPIKDAARRAIRQRKIVTTARKAFLRNGYGQTTMSSIAGELGGSKTTLWSYFRNKQDLFAAVIDDLVDRYGQTLRIELPEVSEPEQALRTLGNSLMATILHPQIIALHRMVTGEAGRAPELGRILFERGINLGKQRISAWMAKQMQHGALRDADPNAAAQDFIALCQAGTYQRHLLGAAPPPSPTVIENEVNCATAAFLRIYGLKDDIKSERCPTIKEDDGRPNATGFAGL